MAFNGWASKIGKTMANHPVGTAMGSMAFGAGVALANMDPLAYTRDTAMDMVLSTGDVKGPEWDNEILGEDISPSQFFPGLPSIHPIRDIDVGVPDDIKRDTLKAIELYRNPTMRENMGAFSKNETAWSNRRSRAQEHSDRGWTNDQVIRRDYPSIPYRAPAQMPYVNGDMVFGLHNGRR